MRSPKAPIAFATAVICIPAAYAQDKPGGPPDVYDAFNRFCIEHFRTEREPLIYEKFGRDLKLIEDGSWRHVSENSACIAWETNLPAVGHVEYGETEQYGSMTKLDERPFYLHLHHLTGLETGKTYHYRLVSVDERGNRVVTPDATMTPREAPEALHIPGDFPGPPYIIDRPDSTIVLKADVIAPGTGIAVMARGVTLDLNGHTVVYNDAGGLLDGVGTVIDEDRLNPKHVVNLAGNSKVMLENTVMICGVGATGQRGAQLRVLNGIIRQGAGCSRSNPNGYGMNPVYLMGAGKGELAGITAEYAGPHVIGIQLGWCGTDFAVHHTVTLDRGSKVINRHRLCFGIGSNTGPYVAHHNLIKRSRQGGMPCNSGEVYHNEIYIDSCATNSSAFLFQGKEEGLGIYGNRIFGTGYHPQAASVSPDGIRFHDNLVFMQATRPSAEQSAEYGAMARVIGFRFTWGGVGNEIYDNLMLFHAKNGGSIRGVQISGMETTHDNVFHDNIIKAIADDEESGRVVFDGTLNFNVTTNGAAVVINGNSIPEVGRNFFRNNRVISNFCNVSFGDNYGIGVNQTFVGNTFVREGKRKDYATFRFMTWQDREVKGHEFADSMFENGAGYDQVQYFGENRMEFSIGHTLTVKTVPGATVTVKDKLGSTAFSGKADAEGKISVAVMEYRQERAGRTDLTPHSITVEKDGKKVSRPVAVDTKREIEIRP